MWFIYVIFYTDLRAWILHDIWQFENKQQQQKEHSSTGTEFHDKTKDDNWTISSIKDDLLNMIIWKVSQIISFLFLETFRMKPRKWNIFLLKTSHEMQKHELKSLERDLAQALIYMVHLHYIFTLLYFKGAVSKFVAPSTACNVIL